MLSVGHCTYYHAKFKPLSWPCSTKTSQQGWLTICTEQQKVPDGTESQSLSRSITAQLLTHKRKEYYDRKNQRRCYPY